MPSRKTKPKGYEYSLSEYKPCIYDSCCGEPVMWGFEIKKHLGEPEFSNLRKYGKLVCVGNGAKSSWFLITKKLNRNKAKAIYGPKTDEVFGPRGGWKSVTFGETTFVTELFKLKPKPYRTTYTGTVCNDVRYDRHGNIIGKG